mmetsp:Transcript_106905/g.190011  ORF Transcript_106905/g.190011 Transcript_106905/m.190011 type:complete len:404 (-) Transcript_106905:68-1279(-)
MASRPTEAQTWLEQYVSEFGRLPENPGQLRDFISNRGGQLSYSAARSILSIAQLHDEFAESRAEEEASDLGSWLQRYQTEMGRSPTASQLATFARNRGGQISFAEAQDLVGSQEQISEPPPRPQLPQGVLPPAEQTYLPPDPPWGSDGLLRRRRPQPPSRAPKREILVKLFEVKGTDCEDCPICLETGGDSWYRLRCRHTFHSGCILDWLQRGNPACPLCRQEAGDEVDAASAQETGLQPATSAAPDIAQESPGASVRASIAQAVGQEPTSQELMMYAAVLAAGAILYSQTVNMDELQRTALPESQAHSEAQAREGSSPPGADSQATSEEAAGSSEGARAGAGMVQCFVNGLADELRRRFEGNQERIDFELDRIMSSLPEAHFMNTMSEDVHALVRRRILESH